MSFLRASFVGVLLGGLLLLLPAPSALAQADFGAVRNVLHDLRRESDGALDWAEVAKGYTDELERLVKDLREAYTDTQWKALSENEKKAFWMNAHLSLVIWQVERNYPIQGSRIRFFPEDSVQQIEKFWENEYPILGGSESLTSIEKRLGEELGDPKCVLALFLGTANGPPVPKEPWRGKYLAQDVEEFLGEYFDGPGALDVDAGEPVLRVPEIISLRREWILQASRAEEKGKAALAGGWAVGPWKAYPEDEARVLAFLEKYLSHPAAQRLKARRHEIRSVALDWHLPDASKKAPGGKGAKASNPLDGGEFNVLPIAPYEERIIKFKPKEPLPGELKPLFGGDDKKNDDKKQDDEKKNDSDAKK